MKYLVSLALVTAFLITPAGILAQSCNTKSHAVHHNSYGHGYHANYYHAQKYDHAFFPIAVFVPTPIFTTAPGVKVSEPIKAQQTSGTAEMREVLDVLRSFDARLKRLEGTPAAPAVQPAPAPANPFAPDERTSLLTAPHGGAVAMAKCAVCHGAASASDKGGGLVFFRDGKLVASERWKAKMADAVSKGRMVPADSDITLSDSEKDALVALFKS